MTSTPFFTYSFRLWTLLTAERMNEMRMATARHSATSEGLLYFCMIFFMTNRPKTTPNPVNNANQSIYITFSLPKIKNMQEEAPEEKTIRYRRVAALTTGLIPIVIKVGPRMNPPPFPIIYPINDANTDKESRQGIFLRLIHLSLSYSIPNFSFRSYSFSTYLTLE